MLDKMAIITADGERDKKDPNLVKLREEEDSQWLLGRVRRRARRKALADSKFGTKK